VQDDVDVHGGVPLQGLHDDGEVSLNEDIPDVEDQSGADAQQAVGAAVRVAQDRVPYPESVGEREFLRQQQCDPAEAVELGVNLAGSRLGRLLCAEDDGFVRRLAWPSNVIKPSS